MLIEAFNKAFNKVNKTLIIKINNKTTGINFINLFLILFKIIFRLSIQIYNKNN